MGRCNVLKTIKDYTETGRINPYYDMYVDEIPIILKASKHIAEAIMDAFTYGYAQGTKATKAEIKRKAKAVKK